MGLPAKRSHWDEMRRLQKEMDDMFEAFFSGGPLGRQISGWGLRAPLSDIEDKGDKLLVTAELPGMDKEDIKINVDKDSITISAERKGKSEEKEKDYYYCERSYSGFRRSFALPSEIDPEDVEAEYKDGVLRVSMKKVSKEGTKKEVKVK